MSMEEGKKIAEEKTNIASYWYQDPKVKENQSSTLKIGQVSFVCIKL